MPDWANIFFFMIFEKRCDDAVWLYRGEIAGNQPSPPDWVTESLVLGDIEDEPYRALYTILFSTRSTLRLVIVGGLLPLFALDYSY
jgi:hypothetical protein